jgi:stalled ribosome rescue protein Dom34
MTDEKVLLEALSSPDFKVSVHDKKRIDVLETETAEETRKQFGEDPYPTAVSDKKNDDTKSLLAIVKSMSTNQRKNIIELLKQNGLDDPLTKEKIVQNSFTVEKIIRNNASN